MKAPERSRASLNAIAPSPIASVVGPSGVTSSASDSGANARGKSSALSNSSTSSIRQLGGEHLTPTGVDDRDHGVEEARRHHRGGRPSHRRAGSWPRERQRLQRRDSDERYVSGARERARRGDSDPQSGERPGPDADRDAIDVPPADPGAVEHHRGERQEPGGVARALAGAGIVAGRVHDLADARQRNGRRARGGIEREDSQGASIVTTRRSPPACSITTRAASRVSPRSSPTAFSGHSTNATVSGPM